MTENYKSERMRIKADIMMHVSKRQELTCIIFFLNSLKIPVIREDQKAETKRKTKKEEENIK